MRGGGVRKRGKEGLQEIARRKRRMEKRGGKKSSWSKTKNPIDEFGCRNILLRVVHESRSDCVLRCPCAFNSMQVLVFVLQRCVYLNLSEESQRFLCCSQRHSVSVLRYFFLSEIPLPDINANHAQPCLFASGSSDTATG